MNDTLALGLAGGAGVLLGAVFFGGLWWTVNKGVSSPRPALWFAGSMVVRTGIALAGFYVVSGGHWGRLVACLLGFTAARSAVVWRTRPASTARTPRVEEVGHASES